MVHVIRYTCVLDMKCILLDEQIVSRVGKLLEISHICRLIASLVTRGGTNGLTDGRGKVALRTLTIVDMYGKVMVRASILIKWWHIVKYGMVNARGSTD